MGGWDRFVETFFNAKVMAKYLPDILSGMVVTIELALLIVVTGLAAGLALALLRSLGIRPLNWLIIFIVDLFRSLPPLVIIVLMYFGLPYAGPSPSGFVSTWLSLALVLMAFSEEIFWAGITSIHRGQWEASRSTGLSYGQTLFNVILPQAFRLTIPPLTNRRGRHRDSGAGEFGRIELLQSVAADDGRRSLHRAVLPGGRRGPLDRNQVRLEAVRATQ